MSESGRQNQTPRRLRPIRSRPTIGLFVTDLGYEQAFEVWSGVHEAARELGANAICFPAGNLDQRTEDGNPRGVLSELATAGTIDGLITFYWWPDRGAFERFYDRYGVPVVNVMRLYEGYPGVAIDNYQDMRNVMRHAIEVHGYRRIAYVRRLRTNLTSETRYRAYVDALAEAGIPFDQTLLVPCDYAQGSEVGTRTVAHLFDNLGLDPSTDLDAIATYSDAYGVRILRALRNRGVNVPYDVAVLGFDDDVGSDATIPPLTTMAMPRHEMGRRAVELLLAQIRDERIPERTLVPSNLVVRQSCGCLSPAVSEAGYIPQLQPVHVAVNAPSEVQTVEEAWDERRPQILADLLRAVGRQDDRTLVGPVTELLDAFSAEVRATSVGVFLPKLDSVVCQDLSQDRDVAVWQAAITALRRHFSLVGTPGSQAWHRAEGLCGQARVLVADRTGLGYVQRQVHRVQREQTTSETGQMLAAAPDLATLIDVAAERLPLMGIELCYLSLYQDPAEPLAGASLLLAYDRSQRWKLDPGQARFPTRDLLPKRHQFDARERYSLVVEPLWALQEQLGFVLLGAKATGPLLPGSLYEILRDQLAVALRSAQLVEETRHARLELESRADQLQAVTDVSTTVSSVIELATLSQRVVNVALERFDLYYAGLFLVDRTGEWTGEPGRWAVLRAGTGGAGREMVARGHKLEIGGASMIGRCVASGKADIQLRIGDADVRFANPLLPHTRSEMALPLVSRGEVLGALTIQSTVEGAFTQGDIAVLQSMANQVANAIANARLVETTQARVREMEILERISTTVSSMFALDHTLDSVVDALSQELGFSYIAINVIDRQANELQTPRGFGLAANLQGMVRSLDDMADDILLDVARKKAIEVVEGWDERFDREIWERGGHEELVRAFVPLLVREEAIGILEVGYYRQERARITGEQVRLLRGIADRIAVAIENARLIEQTRGALQESQMLYTITQGISTARDEGELLAALARPGREMGASNVELVYVEPDESGQPEWAEVVASWRRPSPRAGPPPAGERLAVPVGTRYNLRDADPLAQFWATHADQATLIEDVRVDAEGVDAQLEALLVNHYGVRAMACVPLLQAGHWVGILSFGWAEPHAFSAREVALYGTLSGLASPAVEGRQLLAQAQDRVRREQAMREVSERVRRAADVDTVMRAAAFEVGRLLNREAFVVLANGEAAAPVQPDSGNGGV